MESKSLKDQIISGVFWRFGERICAQIVTFIVSIVLARLLEPSDYGVIALVTVFIAIANVFVTDGFGKALIQKKDIDNSDYSSVFYFNILFSLIIYLIVYLLAPQISFFYEDTILIPVLRVLALRIPLAAINSIQQAYVSRNMLFKRFFWSTFFGTITSGVIGILMAINGFGVWALVAQYLSNSFIDTIILWCTVKWRPQLKFSFVRLLDLIKFGWKVLLTSLINSLYDNIRSLIIGKSFTKLDLAHFNRGLQYPNLIILNVNTTIGSVLFPAMSKLQDDKNRLKESVRKSISLSTFMIFPMMFGLATISPYLIEWMLTDKWLPSVPYLKIACIYLSFYPINIANLQAILAIGRSDIYLRLNLIKKIIGIVSVIISIPFGVFALASSEIFVAIVSVIINVSVNKLFLNYSLLDLLKDISKNMLMASMMCGVIVVFDKYIFFSLSNLGLIVLCEVMVGLIVYLILSVVMKSKELLYILRIVKNK